MKILYYSSPSFGDCDFPLIKALKDKGHDVFVLYFINPHCLKTTIFNIEKIYPKSGIFPISIYPELLNLQKYIPLDHFYIANETTGRWGWNSFKINMRILSFFKKINPDVINYVPIPNIFHCFPLWFFKSKLVMTIHDGKPHTGEGSRKDEFIRKVISKYVKKFILLNKGEVEIFAQRYNISLKRIFQSRLGYYDILNIYGTTQINKQPIILFFGRISKYKGIEYLLESIKIIHKTHPQIKVIIAGKGNYYFDIKEYENLDYIEFRNRYINLDELANLIRSALVTICPYTDATQSGVVNSSFALNTPVIATNVGGLPEMIENGKNGILVPPKDVEALTQAILSLLENPNILKLFSDNIKINTKEGKNSWSYIADEYINIYKQ